jgi:hypothetical protein
VEEKKQLTVRQEAMENASQRAAYGQDRKAKRESLEKEKMMKKLWGMQVLCSARSAYRVCSVCGVWCVVCGVWWVVCVAEDGAEAIEHASAVYSV